MTVKDREIVKDTGLGKDVLSRNPIAQEIRERIDKWDYIKLKTTA
jgi:hypothetical protein